MSGNAAGVPLEVLNAPADAVIVARFATGTPGEVAYRTIANLRRALPGDWRVIGVAGDLALEALTTEQLAALGLKRIGDGE